MNLTIEPASVIAPDGSVAPPTKRTRLVLIVSTVSWLSLAILGLWFLWGYETTPGIAAQSPRKWPAESRIQLSPDKETLVMLAHPHCPCTRASLGELGSIMAHSGGRVRAYVLFIKPENAGAGWELTDLWQSASGIPGVKTILDGDGREARLFNAATSG
ncbi:MAG TPA: hypothetical protein VMS31_16675, partial [Pyrinomonadaceae bacterium]|nr:hypothetical protein [Pyrinomonadaceae bacterium]